MRERTHFREKWRESIFKEDYDLADSFPLDVSHLNEAATSVTQRRVVGKI